jgi:hypothetical protein
MWGNGKKVVTKTGAATGTTNGVWIGIADRIPKAGRRWVKGKIFGVVEWVDLETPFAEGGDSGALVYLKEGTKIVPLGIHRGSVDGLSFYTFEGDVFKALEHVMDMSLFFFVLANCHPHEVPCARISVCSEVRLVG